MKIRQIIFALTIFLFAGCTITQEYHFNTDFSGNYEMELDMGQLINVMKSMDTTGKMNSIDTINNSFNELKEQYKNAGAKNAEVGWKNEKTILFIKFDFENTENLSKILENSGKSSDFLSISGASGTPTFSNKGNKKLIINFPELENDSISLKDLEQKKDYLNFKTIFSFDKEIKKLNNESAILSKDNKSFKFEGKIDDFLKKGFTMDSEILFKRK